MSQNAITFENHLKRRKLSLGKGMDGDTTVFYTTEHLESIGNVNLGILFYKNDLAVSILAHQYLQITNPLKKAYISELINTLNCEYNYNKFVEVDNYISSRISLPFDDNFSPEVVIHMLVAMIEALKETYPRFMKIMWS